MGDTDARVEEIVIRVRVEHGRSIVLGEVLGGPRGRRRVLWRAAWRVDRGAAGLRREQPYLVFWHVVGAFNDGRHRQPLSRPIADVLAEDRLR